MKVLLDTHALLWAYWGDPQMSTEAVRLISDPANRILVSPASHWEIAIKMKTGKLTLRESFCGVRSARGLRQRVRDTPD